MQELCTISSSGTVYMYHAGVQTNLFRNQPLGPVTFQCYQPNAKFTSPHKNFINFQLLYANVYEYKKCNITTMYQDMSTVLARVQFTRFPRFGFLLCHGQGCKLTCLVTSHAVVNYHQTSHFSL